ncbi:hypothetical protein P8629_07285 [Hydrogenovibrio sp. 3SP14C1]|uniref:hypothetical protein n=1 Tax=Hydrogenovibrio sp. 3SP14C1 TaxID=3038774 RepID=UPI0024180AF9|nr:hypothetical protein [Hydrogenovibrio sp. 3SP14C1]MDG4812806.1 hypothetical protein [Hydrogenovibrio sp. 3SP14C1]
MLTTVLKSLLIISVMLTLPGNVSAADRPKPIDKITLLGLDLTKSSLDSVRQQLWDIGGFQQARSTVRQRNIDKFFSVSRFKDSYYVEFHYDNAGNVTSAYQLFEYRTIEFQNRRTPVQTRAVALEIMQQIGQPTQVIRKGWGGMPGYNAYIWKNDLMTVEVDREGSEILGNVFVKYTVNTDPYFVADKDKPQ